MREVLASMLGLVVFSNLYAQGLSPVRKTEGTNVTSASDPALRIELPSQASYVGGARWIMFNVADCELHVFVEADEQKEIVRLYWIQFEGYVPERQDLTYSYTDPNKTMAAGMEFFVSTGLGSSMDTPRPGSDNEKVRTLLLAAGYKAPPEMMSVRLVHLLDREQRRELMLIYAEDLATTGLSVSQLDSSGSEHSRWPDISESLVQRAIGSFSFHRLAEH
jgi:hypothetical protein